MSSIKVLCWLVNDVSGSTHKLRREGGRGRGRWGEREGGAGGGRERKEGEGGRSRGKKRKGGAGKGIRREEQGEEEGGGGRSREEGHGGRGRNRGGRSRERKREGGAGEGGAGEGRGERWRGGRGRSKFEEGKDGETGGECKEDCIHTRIPFTEKKSSWILLWGASKGMGTAHIPEASTHFTKPGNIKQTSSIPL